MDLIKALHEAVPAMKQQAPWKNRRKHIPVRTWIQLDTSFWGGGMGKRHNIANWRGLEWFGFKVLIYYNLDFVYYLYLYLYLYFYIFIFIFIFIFIYFIHTHIYIYMQSFPQPSSSSALSIPTIWRRKHHQIFRFLAPVLRWWRSAFLKNPWNLVLGKGLGILGVI